jgi:hypothetical protein
MTGSGGRVADQFWLTGRMQQVQAYGEQVPGVAAAPAPKRVTHVMAVNPSSQNPKRVMAPVTSGGTFSLALEPGHPWVVVFVDSSRVGADMIAGIFRSSTLDTVAPAVPGAGDLGMVEVIGDGTAAPGIDYDTLLTTLHLSSDDAELLGAVDDVCLRYVNPDVDGDGMIDQMQPGHDFRMDFHVQFGMSGGGGLPAASGVANSIISDIVGAFLPPTSGIRYGGVGIYVSQPAAYSPVDTTTSWAQFDQPITYYPGGMNPTLHTAAAGERIAGVDLMLGALGDSRTEGIYAAAGADMPQGSYAWGIGAHTLTFTNVRTHSDARLAAATNFIMPFIKLVPRDVGCSVGCPLGSLDYQWMKRTEAGWVMAIASELNLIVGEAGGNAAFARSFDNGTARASFTIPADVVSGTIPWTTARLEGMTAAELASMTTDEICHLGLSYDDKLGMRMFGAIANTPGTCPTR